jgi:hypothetical protein
VRISQEIENQLKEEESNFTSSMKSTSQKQGKIPASYCSTTEAYITMYYLKERVMIIIIAFQRPIWLDVREIHEYMYHHYSE